MNILISQPEGEVRSTFFTPDVIEKLSKIGKIIWNKHERQFTKEELREEIKDIDICISGWGCQRFNEDILENANKLKIVAHTGGSVATLASDVLYEKNIKLISGNWVFAESVAEAVIGYSLCSLRDLVFYNNEVQAGRWHDGKFYNEGILDQSFGLVGFGTVAKYLVKMLRPFRAKIRVYDPYLTDSVANEYGVEKATLEEIFKNSKIISLHAAKTPETYHLIDKRLLKMIPYGALLVNTARGSVIDEEALADELVTGRFKAILDVYELEPLPEHSKLRGLKNVVLIPHMAGPTIDRRKYVTLELIKDIEGFLQNGILKYEINKNHAFHMSA
jgi:phosphoglycerate dehydrogenase-like enzyme